MPNRLIAHFLYILLLTAQLLATPLLAEPTLEESSPTGSLLVEPPPSANNLFPSSSNSSLLGEPLEFLPVTKAYQLNVHYEEQTLVFDWTLKPSYYLYQHRFKFFNTDGSPLDIPPDYEKPGKRIYDDYYEKELEVYYHQARFSIPWDTSAGEKATNKNTLVAESQACADAGLCYPPRRQILTVNTSTVTNTTNVTVAEVELGAENLVSPIGQQSALQSNLLLMLLFAMIGGAILNLMPCVFPVLSIKALSLATSHLSKHGKHLHGLAYTCGIVFSFMAIAAILMLLRDAGEAIGWGFQLQSPLFVGLLVYLFVLMGLSFSGLLTFGTSLMNLGQSTTQGHSLTSSFMTGLLATLVASPCTAPFMGTALGFALTQPTWIAMSTFACLGLGMALPLLILSWWPGMAGKMPKSGRWMERFKEFLAFPLYLSAVWLLWVLGRQAGSDTVAAVICGVVLILFALWLLKIRNSGINTTTAIIAVILALLLPWKTHNNHDDQDKAWQPYSEAKLQQLLTNGDAVFVNLTADWCITCLANEKLALSSDRFLATLKENNITYLKGDWTNYNLEITQLLNRHHRSGVPLYLFYPTGTVEPHILPQLLTENIAIDAISPQKP